MSSPCITPSVYDEFADFVSPVLQKIRIRLNRSTTSTNESAATCDPLGSASNCINDAQPLLTPDKLVASRADIIVKRLTARLREDVSDLKRNEGISFDQVIIEKCVTKARHMASILALGNELKVSAFADEDGAASLVAQSLVTDRRISLRLTGPEKEFQVVRIDEQMRASTSTMAPSDRSAAQELASWVTRYS